MSIFTFWRKKSKHYTDTEQTLSRSIDISDRSENLSTDVALDGGIASNTHGDHVSISRTPESAEKFALIEPDYTGEGGDNVSWPCYASKELFDFIVEEAKDAIANGMDPIRISRGSSGSYFVRNPSGHVVGVFKPKNEEPYGKLNPKWTKWLHKHLFPCCFGRSCLIPNLGYISEASASVVDRHLKLNIVPRTEVIELASKAFYYGPIDRRQSKAKGLPLKIGSFQLFLKGYKDASTWLRKFNEKPLDESEKKAFQIQFEKLVLLDYIIRNTDRGNDNWMIYYQRGENDVEHTNGVYIAAIDHGLAFPFKHPDNWRSYPYAWAFMPASRVPFSQETIDTYLPLLQNPTVIEGLFQELRSINELDKDFDKSRFKQQVAVMRGQIQRVIETLQENGSPFSLMQKPLLAIYDDSNSSVSVPFAEKAARFVTSVKAQPCFKNW